MFTERHTASCVHLAVPRVPADRFVWLVLCQLGVVFDAYSDWSAQLPVRTTPIGVSVPSRFTRSSAMVRGESRCAKQKDRGTRGRYGTKEQSHAEQLPPGRCGYLQPKAVTRANFLQSYQRAGTTVAPSTFWKPCINRRYECRIGFTTRSTRAWKSSTLTARRSAWLARRSAVTSMSTPDFSAPRNTTSRSALSRR